MTDTFAPEAPPPGPLPTMPPGVPTGQAPVALPPDPSAIIQAMVAGAKKPQLDSGVSARDRLLLGPKVRSGDLTPKVPETAPEPDVLARELTGSKDRKTLVNVGARMAQVRAASPDPDKAAADWKRLKGARHLLPDKMRNQFDSLLAGDPLPEEEWSEFSLNVSKTAEAVDKVADDWTVGSGQVKGIDPRPDGVSIHVAYDDVSDVEKLPDSLTGDSGPSLPAHTLLKETSGGLDVFVGHSDVTYAAKPTQEVDFAIRAEFPGPIGSDGVPRWTKVAPLPITDHAVIQAGLAHEPLAVVESFADPEAYCGVHPGDYIVFDVPDKKGRSWQAPSWAKGVYPLRAGVARSAPEVSYAPIGKEDIPDVSTAYDRLEDTSWAVLDVEPSRLSALGLKPFEVQRSDGGTAQLVFGAIPADLEDLTDGPIYTTDGIVGSDDPDSDLPSFSFRTGSGTVAWAAEDGDSSGAVSRVDRRARRMAYRVDPDHAKRIAQLASDFEVSGASNVAIYSRQAKLDGFEPARERLFSDGVSLKVVRTADPVIGDPHAIPVHVRSAAGLPKGRVPIDPEKIVTGMDPNGRHFRVEATDDLAEATRTAAVLAQKYGYDQVKIDTPDGEVRIFEPS